MCDPSVGGADSSPSRGRQQRLHTRGGASGTDESVPYEICGGCGRDRITPHPSQATPSPQGEGKASYLRHVSGAKRTSMGKISRRPRNMSKHRTALLIILSPETPMVKVFESMP